MLKELKKIDLVVIRNGKIVRVDFELKSKS